VLVAISLAVQPMGWPRWVGDLAVATAFTLTGPDILFRLTGGSSAAWFARLRHRRWWACIYLATCAAIFAPRFVWPSPIPLLFGAVALTAAAWLLVARRPIFVPEGR